MSTEAPRSSRRDAGPAPDGGVRRFVATWTLAVMAAVCAFALHLAMRSKSVALGYEIGRARAEQARLREVKRVLQLEAASYKTPERVEIVARTLLGMEPPPPERIIVVGAVPDRDQAAKTAGREPNADQGASP